MPSSSFHFPPFFRWPAYVYIFMQDPNHFNQANVHIGHNGPIHNPTYQTMHALSWVNYRPRLRSLPHLNSCDFVRISILLPNIYFNNRKNRKYVILLKMRQISVLPCNNLCIPLMKNLISVEKFVHLKQNT